VARDARRHSRARGLAGGVLGAQQHGQGVGERVADFCSSDDCWDQCEEWWGASKTVGSMLYQRVQHRAGNWITEEWLQQDIFTERCRVKVLRARSSRRPVEVGDGGWSRCSSSCAAAGKPPAPEPPKGWCEVECENGWRYFVVRAD